MSDMKVIKANTRKDLERKLRLVEDMTREAEVMSLELPELSEMLTCMVGMIQRQIKKDRAYLNEINGANR